MARSLCQERDREKDRSLKMLNVYAGYGLDDAASTAMADVKSTWCAWTRSRLTLGGRAARRRVALSEKAAKLYVAGFGNEVGYDDGDRSARLASRSACSSSSASS